MIRLPLTSLALLSLTALGVGSAFGQADMLPVSRTTGVLTVSLPINKATFMALPLANIVASGTVTTVDGANSYTLASTPASLPDLLTQPHAIKIISRVDQRGTGGSAPAGTSTNGYGLSARITAAAGQSVTAALSTPPNAGDQYVIYSLRTLGAAFTGVVLNTGVEASADVVYLSNGSGGFTGYYNDGSAWLLLSTTTGDQSGVIIEPGSALLVVRKNAGSPASLVFTGVTLPGREAASVAAGYRLVNNPFSVSTTLEASGLQNNITGGAGAGAADLVYLENNGVLTGYYYKNAGLGGRGWRALGDNVSNQGAALVRPGKALLFKEQAGTVGFALPEPFAE